MSDSRTLPAPRTNDELARVYGPYIRRLGLARGIGQNDIDDFTQTVLLTFIERDSVAFYWQHWASTPAAERGPFSTWLRGYVVKRAYSFRRDATRPVLDLIGGPDEVRTHDTQPRHEFDPAYAETDKQLAWIVSRSAFASFLDHLESLDADLHAVAWHVCDQGLRQEEVNRNTIADALGFSRSKVNTLVYRLRALAEEWGVFDA